MKRAFILPIRYVPQPAKGIAGPVTLVHGNVVGRVAQFHGYGEIETGGATAEADDLHDSTCRIVSVQQILGQYILNVK